MLYQAALFWVGGANIHRAATQTSRCNVNVRCPRPFGCRFAALCCELVTKNISKKIAARWKIPHFDLPYIIGACVRHGPGAVPAEWGLAVVMTMKIDREDCGRGWGRYRRRAGLSSPHPTKLCKKTLKAISSSRTVP